ARASVRYSCRVCGVELEHRQSDTERIAWVASAICLLALFGGLILRDYFGTRVSDAVLLVTSVLASISFVVGALVWMSTQHSSSRPTRPPVDQSAALTCPKGWSRAWSHSHSAGLAPMSCRSSSRSTTRPASFSSRRGSSWHSIRATPLSLQSLFAGRRRSSEGLPTSQSIKRMNRSGSLH